MSITRSTNPAAYSFAGFLDQRLYCEGYVRRRRGYGIPDVSITLKWPIFIGQTLPVVIDSVRSWLQQNLFTDLSPMELVSTESISRVDYRYDFLILEFSPHSIDTKAQDNTVTRLSRGRLYDEGFFTGFDLGSASDAMFKLYDKGEERWEKDKMRDIVLLWNLPDLNYDPYDGTLRFDNGTGAPVRVWRFEWRFNRDVLLKEGITTFEDLMEKLPGLRRDAFKRRAVMRIPARANRVRSTHPVAPLWFALQHASGIRVRKETRKYRSPGNNLH